MTGFNSAMRDLHKDKFICLLLLFLGLFLFTRSLSVHGLEYRDDEIFYFKSTQEMLQHGNLLSPTYFGENRFQKPILFYWLMLVSYQIFGVNWAGARMISVILASLTVCVTFLTARELFKNRTVAILSALILMTTPLFFRHAKNAVPDMALNFFIVLSLYLAAKYFLPSLIPGSDSKIPPWQGEFLNILFYVTCALGFMIKGFAALIIPFLTAAVFVISTKGWRRLSELKFGRGLLICLTIILPWFIFMIVSHGQEYWDYMTVQETKNRLLGDTGGHLVFERIKALAEHVLFYLRVLFSYFLPWGIFLLPAVIGGWARMRQKKEGADGIRWLLIWLSVVFCFFSFMYFVINHYLLVLTTPFAILISYFFVAVTPGRKAAQFVLTLFRKHVVAVLFTIVALAYVVLFVFLAGASRLWLPGILTVYLCTVCYMMISRRAVTAPVLLAVVMLLGLSQSRLVNQAGVTTHPTLQRFAQIVNSQKGDTSIIGVGSHDIHEKEWQVYFDTRVEKAAASDPQETAMMLTNFFSSRNDAFCLMTLQDYNRFLKDTYGNKLTVIQEDYIVRRRMYLDKDFFTALLTLDQTTVRDYLKEKIVLVRKERDA